MFNPVPPLYLPDVISYYNESAHLTFRVLSWSVLLDQGVVTELTSMLVILN